MSLKKKCKSTQMQIVNSRHAPQVAVYSRLRIQCV